MWRAVHWVSDDPGGSDSGCAGGFSRDARPAIEKPEGGGVYGTNTPNVVKVDGGYRMYYTLIGPTPDNPLGCNDYTSATSEIRSAFSSDGSQWEAEDGVRLAPHAGGAELRVVSPDVVPLDDSGLRYRMYYEGVAAAGDEARHDAGIRSAISEDGGMHFTPEPGWRLKPSGAGLSLSLSLSVCVCVCVCVCVALQKLTLANPGRRFNKLASSLATARRSQPSNVRVAEWS